MTRSLFEIGADLERINDLMEVGDGGEINADLDTELAALADAIALEEAEKLDGCIYYLKRLEMEEQAARDEADVYRKFAEMQKGKRDRFKAFLMAYLERSGRKKVQTAKMRTLAIQANGGKQAVTVGKMYTLHPEIVPDHLVKMVRELDSDAIRNGLETHDPDAMRIATLEPRGFHVRIR